MPLLALKEVTAGYGQIKVLHDLSLMVEKREIVTILGANGSGKSTVLKTAIGIARLTKGVVEFNSEDISHTLAHRRAALGIGYVPQTRNVFSELTVIDNLRMGAFIRPQAFKTDLQEVFDLFPRLKERKKEKAGTLSGGERRMLSIGLTLLLKPKLLLIDEPSSDLSPAMVGQVFETIVRIYRELGISVLLVEQNVSKALEIAKRVYVLVRGKEALNAATENVNSEQLRLLFLQGTNDTDL